MQLLDGDPVTLAKGKWNFKTVIGTGTASVAYKQTVDDSDGNFNEIPGTNVSASDFANYELPQCEVVATITGDAVVTVAKVV